MPAPTEPAGWLLALSSAPPPLSPEVVRALGDDPDATVAIDDDVRALLRAGPRPSQPPVGAGTEVAWTHARDQVTTLLTRLLGYREGVTLTTDPVLTAPHPLTTSPIPADLLVHAADHPDDVRLVVLCGPAVGPLPGPLDPTRAREHHGWLATPVQRAVAVARHAGADLALVSSGVEHLLVEAVTGTDGWVHWHAAALADDASADGLVTLLHAARVLDPTRPLARLVAETATQRRRLVDRLAAQAVTAAAMVEAAGVVDTHAAGEGGAGAEAATRSTAARRVVLRRLLLQVAAARGLPPDVLEAATVQTAAGSQPAADPPVDPALLAAVDRRIVTVDGHPVGALHLGVDELGRVHELLLERAGATADGAGGAGADGPGAGGNARSASGSYLTPPALVATVLDHVLEPVVREVVAAADPDARAAALLGLTVCDPACGAGAFLVAAARRLAAHLTELRRGSSGAGPTGTELAEVVGTCLYGVDLDPAAVELTRGILALEAHAGVGPRLPLDQRVVVGDALVGAWRTDLDGAEVLERRAADAWCASRLGGELDRPVLHWELAFPELGPADEGLFDVVVGNPPYLRGREHTQLDPVGRRFATARWSACTGATWNLYVPFVLQAARLARRRSGLLVQASVLGARFAGALHEQLLRDHGVAGCLDLSEVAGLFADASVQVACLVVTRVPSPTAVFRRYDRHLHLRTEVAVTAEQLTRLPRGAWTLPASGLDAADVAWFVDAELRLGQVADIRDGMEQTAAYAVQPLVREATGAPGELKLTPTGLIDPFVSHWGERSVRYLGARYDRPVVDPAALRADGFAVMAEQGAAVKLAVAGLARRIEAVVDEGTALVSKSAMVIRLTDPRICPYAVAVVLNATRTSRLYDAAFGALGFGAGSRNYRPPALRELPLPPRELLQPSNQVGTLSELGRRLSRQRRPDQAAVDQLMASTLAMTMTRSAATEPAATSPAADASSPRSRPTPAPAPPPAAPRRAPAPRSPGGR